MMQTEENIPRKNKVLAQVWEALFAGDAMGMPTEFMTRKEIRQKFGYVDGLIATEASKLHRDLPTGSVTDDSEQNIYLMRTYSAQGYVSVENTASTLLRWAAETRAEEKHYMGPSAQKALRAIESGASPYESGKAGTTCGGIMRTPCVVLFDPEQTEEELIQNVRNCLIPTHNTQEAMEAAGAYAFALRSALAGKNREMVFQDALRGATALCYDMETDRCSPSSAARIREAHLRCWKMGREELLDWLYDVPGTGLSSADVCGAVFSIWEKAQTNVFEAVCMGASVGGDTDTIAALAGALCAAFAGGHNIPGDLTRRILEVNWLDSYELAQRTIWKSA